MVRVSGGAGWRLLFILLLLRGIRRSVSIEPCPSTAQDVNVTTTQEATDLARALNCSGAGEFRVLWEGEVYVNETIAVTGGSVLNVTGVGSGALADGGGTTQLFNVANSTLNLANISLENGDGYSGDVSGYSGGAVWAGGVDSVVSCSGTTAFSNNIALNGGAVSMEDGAVGSFSGDTLFNGNAANSVYGGAVMVATGASLSWSGHTNFTLNSAYVGGGALFSDGGNFSWSGETHFVLNSAGSYGGSVLSRFSNVSWSGVTSFENSTLLGGSESGGTVQVEDSVLTWQGNSSFIGGRGGVGGALHAARSDVTWTGETVFRDNSVDLRGGALSLEDSSTASWSGTTYFTNNSAENGNGGAVYAGDNSSALWGGTTAFENNTASENGGAVYAGGDSSAIWGGATTFEGNTASQNGGAVSISGEMPLYREVEGATLSLGGNYAGTAGGAVHQSGTTKGLTWRGASFISNHALNGGAVYTVASGTAQEDSDSFPSMYIDCIFQNNTAVASGGALESSAGKDTFLNTRFEGNTAGAIGGALRMAGTTDLTLCDFVANSANETGPAVASVGTTVVISSSFENNVLLCASGAFLNFTVEGNGTPEEEVNDYYTSVCEGCSECIGADCTANGRGTLQCVPALENTMSVGVTVSGVPVTLETLELDVGYWRSLSNSTTVLPCWNTDACLGGITDTADFCAEGYRGPYCAICEDGYATTLAYTCSECSNGEGIAFGVVALLVALAAFVAATLHLRSKPHATQKTRFRQLMQVLPVQGLKTLVVAWQILTQFDAVANVTYAGVYGKFLDGVSSIVSLDLGLVVSAGCMARTDFHDRLLLSTLGPLVTLCAVGVSFLVAEQRSHGSEEGLQTARRKHFAMALLITFLVYSSVSSTVFRAFDCETLDDGKEYLRADYSIECTTVKHKALQVYAGFMILLYPIGIPFLYGLLLFKHREVLQNRRHHPVTHSVDVEVTADLWKSYTPERYYYEVVECARRVTLTGVVVFIYPNTAAQVAVTLVLAFVFVLVSEILAPYASGQDAWLSRVGHVVVFMSMFQALMLKVDVSEETSDSQQVFGGVLLTSNICMVAAVIAEATLVICYVCRRKGADFDESVAPGLRNTTSTRSVVAFWDKIEREDAETSTDTVP